MTMSEQYLAIANQHREEAEATTLANVRQRYLQSETAWLRMAERLCRTKRASIEARPEQRPGNEPMFSCRVVRSGPLRRAAAYLGNPSRSATSRAMTRLAYTPSMVCSLSIGAPRALFRRTLSTHGYSGLVAKQNRCIEPHTATLAIDPWVLRKALILAELGDPEDVLIGSDRMAGTGQPTARQVRFGSGDQALHDCGALRRNGRRGAEPIRSRCRAARMRPLPSSTLREPKRSR
jgi:hypothetical protein